MDVSAVRHGLTNGVAVYTANLARALLRLSTPELVAWYCARRTAAAEAVLEELASLGARVARCPAPWRWSPDGAWWLPWAPPFAAVLDGVDVFHIGEFQLPRSGPAAPPFVATVHDLTTLTHPAHHTLLNRVVHRRRLRWIRRHAARVIAVSDSTGRDLGTRAGIGAGRVTVVHEARGHALPTPDDPDAVLRRYDVGRPYVLAVGTLEPRKNHVRLVHAFEGLDRHAPELVLVGARGWRSRHIAKAIEASPARERIRVLGPVPAADLAALYARATVFAYPSLYEGFGLPVLEAMAAGVPVLTSDRSSLPEVAGDAAVLVDPGSIESIRAGLARLLAEPGLRERLGAAGAARERTFTWERTARETLEAYHEAAGGRTGPTP